jgi:hypothetical protein
MKTKRTKGSIKVAPSTRSEHKKAVGMTALKNLLDLPDGTGFESKTVRVGLDAIIKLSEENLLRFNSRPGAAEQRLRDKHNVEFVL